MTAIVILLVALVVILASIPFGADSRKTNGHGHYRPNWL
jgi:hypothetical protein